MVHLKYGRGSLDFPIPSSWHTGEVEFRPYPALTDAAEAIRQALRSPIGSRPLREVVHSGERVCVVVNDATRKARSELFMPILLDELNAAGVENGDVFAMVATGTHRPATQTDMAALVGETVAARIPIYGHDCHDDANLVPMGMTKRGTPVLINKMAAAADRRVLTGSVVHHWFAGFGGGKKALVPGVSGYNTIRANHSLLLDPASRIGVLDGNPAAEDQLEAARMVGSDFLLNTVLGENGEILGVFAGDMDLAHRQACALADRVYSGYRVEPADVVFASCGGWPKDIDVYQAQKSLENGALACRPGGVVVLAAECPEGIGSNKYWEWAQRYSTLPELEQAIRERFEIGGHKAYAMGRLTARCNVVLVSNLPPETVRTLGFTPASTAEEAIDAAISLLGSPTGPISATVMPCASLTIPVS